MRWNGARGGLTAREEHLDASRLQVLDCRSKVCGRSCSCDAVTLRAAEGLNFHLSASVNVKDVERKGVTQATIKCIVHMYSDRLSCRSSELQKQALAKASVQSPRNIINGAPNGGPLRCTCFKLQDRSLMWWLAILCIQGFEFCCCVGRPGGREMCDVCSRA